MGVNHSIIYNFFVNPVSNGVRTRPEADPPVAFRHVRRNAKEGKNVRAAGPGAAARVAIDRDATGTAINLSAPRKRLGVVDFTQFGNASKYAHVHSTTTRRSREIPGVPTGNPTSSYAVKGDIIILSNGRGDLAAEYLRRP